MAPKTKEDETRTVRVLRLSKEADKALRSNIQRKGDVSICVNQALTETDLLSLQVKPRSKAPGSGREEHFNTSVKFDPTIYEAVTAAAKSLGVSATALIDAAIISFYKKKPAKKSASKP